MSSSSLPSASLMRLLGARLALFALLVSAFVPTISRLAQPAGYDAPSALCRSALADGRKSGGSPTVPHGEHAEGDACALCTLAHHLPTLAGTARPAVAMLSYAPPLPRALPGVRTHSTQSRAPGARAPPALG